ncbi:MAG: hypothetical protein ACREHG_04955 [Candidatus Saccharimonadales bacterium]
MDDYVFVWRDAPADTAGFTPLVRAANGAGVTASDGFNYQTSYGRWTSKHGAGLPAWTYMYPGNPGNSVASALIGAAPAAAYYVIDIEESGVSSAEVSKCVAALRGRAPVYLSTWGDVAQADQRSIPYASVGFHGVMPQTYYDYQGGDIARWESIFPEVYPTFAPADDTAWATLVSRNACGIWRFGTADLAACRSAIDTRRQSLPGDPAPGDDMPLNADDISKITHAIGVEFGFHDGSMKTTIEQYVSAQLAPVVADLAAIKAAIANLAAGAGPSAGAK